MPDKPLTPGTWRIWYEGETLHFAAPDGTERARYANVQVLAEHHAMSLEYADRLEAEIARLCEAGAALADALCLLDVDRIATGRVSVDTRSQIVIALALWDAAKGDAPQPSGLATGSKRVMVVDEIGGQSVVGCPDCGIIFVSPDVFEGGKPISGICPKCGERLNFA